MSGCRKILLIVFTGYWIIACNSTLELKTTSAPALSAIRNNKDIMDIKNSLFVAHPKYDNFSICHGNTCKYIVQMALSEREWKEIRTNFMPHAPTAIEERERIRIAIALFESIIGSKTGTSHDKGKNFPGLGLKGQMDCVDEATNTSVYLTLLQDQHLLKWHRVLHRTNRGIGTLQVPHFTAVISDIESGSEYAVDSWFLDNGERPYIVPLSAWKLGWQPGDIN
jgi:hypothetical protein